MDPRLKALIEVRDLLKSEGWTLDEADATASDRATSRKGAPGANPILIIISLATLFTCFILIGENHDLRGRRDAMLSVRHVRVIDSANSPDPHLEHLFVTIDGEWAWGAQPTTKPSTDLGQKRDDWHETALKIPTIEIDTRSVLQLWHRRENGGNLLVGQSVVSLDHPDESEFNVIINDTNNPDVRFEIGLKIEKGPRRRVASSKPEFRD